MGWFFKSEEDIVIHRNTSVSAIVAKVMALVDDKQTRVRVGLLDNGDLDRTDFFSIVYSNERPSIYVHRCPRRLFTPERYSMSIHKVDIELTKSEFEKIINRVKKDRSEQKRQEIDEINDKLKKFIDWQPEPIVKEEKAKKNYGTATKRKR